ncbi:hypothetical protein DPMN_100884 [Dreissena polymorpha]|uniref:Uncharacterized protein n=1 Tax=Dreissena polymorpha TaxID=45954 RepID=A0A9D4LGP9_DREPO|nr:hypothetical protein DPMN_100884 [Dreissena polymorpha]
MCLVPETVTCPNPLVDAVLVVFVPEDSGFEMRCVVDVERRNTASSLAGCSSVSVERFLSAFELHIDFVIKPSATESFETV